MIEPAAEKDYPELAEIWERSVRATHHFLEEDYLQLIKSLLIPVIFPAVQIYVYRNHNSAIAGFSGVAENKIEMLFIDPPYRGKGIGKKLTLFAIDHLHISKVDVNEENEQAIRFYLHMGFKITGRTELDPMGKPHPILQMELT